MGVLHLYGGNGYLDLQTGMGCVLHTFPRLGNGLLRETHGDHESRVAHVFRDGFVNNSIFPQIFHCGQLYRIRTQGIRTGGDGRLFAEQKGYVPCGSEFFQCDVRYVNLLHVSYLDFPKFCKVRWRFNKKTLPSPCCQRDENVNFHLCFRGTTLFHPKGCPFDAITSQLCYGSARLPLLHFHGSRSAVSSADLSQCLAPTGISPQAKESAYYSASLRYIGMHYSAFFPICQYIF